MKTKCSIKHGLKRSKCFDYDKGVQDTDPILLPNGSSLNCLLYAHGPVLISSSANGYKMQCLHSPNFDAIGE